MDAELRREIIRRIGERKRDLEDTRTMGAHVEAIAEVFDVDVAEVEAIVAEVVVERAGDRPRGGDSIAALARHPVVVGVAAAVLVGVGALLVQGLPVQGLHGGPSEPPDLAPVPAEVGAVAPDNRRYVQASIIADILASIAPVRMLMMEYRMSEGVFPARLEDIGLGRADMGSGRHIDDLVLGDGGAILVKADPALEPDAYLVMSPRLTMGGLNIEWHCLTNVAVGPLVRCEHDALDGVADRF